MWSPTHAIGRYARTSSPSVRPVELARRCARRSISVAMRQHHALGLAGGARGVEHDGDVVGPRPRRPPRRRPARVRASNCAARAPAPRRSRQARLLVVAQAARVVVHDRLERGHCVWTSSSLSTCSWSSATAKRDLGVLDDVSASPRRPSPGRAAPARRPAPAPRTSPSRAAAGCRRPRRRSPRRSRGGQPERDEAHLLATGSTPCVCQMPKSFSRIAGRSGRAGHARPGAWGTYPERRSRYWPSPSSPASRCPWVAFVV